MNINKSFITIIFLVFFVVGATEFWSCKLIHPAVQSNDISIRDRETLMTMFYNVENLFDTINDPLTNDEEFLPEGTYKWNSFRYYDKLQKISKVIIAVGGWSPPELVGLVEIENLQVLEDLIRLTPLKSSGYEIIHKESPDARGIDVALLYRKKYFKPLYYEFLPVVIKEDPSFRTREILYAKGLVDKTDTLHIFVNHWPSRRAGQTESEKNRIRAAEVLKDKIDSIFKFSPDAYIIIGGDFNDTPSDRSITEILNVASDSMKINDKKLFNLFGYSEERGIGSYKFRLGWEQIDQIIVSTSFFSGGGLSINKNAGQIFTADWLLEEDIKYQGKKPYRTYNGPIYNGGYSDHLPVFTEIMLRK